MELQAQLINRYTSLVLCVKNRYDIFLNRQIVKEIIGYDEDMQFEAEVMIEFFFKDIYENNSNKSYKENFDIYFKYFPEILVECFVNWCITYKISDSPLREENRYITNVTEKLLEYVIDSKYISKENFCHQLTTNIKSYFNKGEKLGYWQNISQFLGTLQRFDFEIPLYTEYFDNMLDLDCGEYNICPMFRIHSCVVLLFNSYYSNGILNDKIKKLVLIFDEWSINPDIETPIATNMYMIGFFDRIYNRRFNNFDQIKNFVFGQ